MPNITQSELKKIMSYDEKSGLFTNINSNKIAGSNNKVPSGKSYCRIQINKTRYLAHRLAWLYVYGEFPLDQIDHIDGNGCNNRILNLRCVTRLENAKNMRLSKRNRLGILGVFFMDSSKSKRRITDKYYSVIIHNKNNHFLGSFNEKWDAICARKSAEYKYGFHVNHGKSRPL